MKFFVRAVEGKKCMLNDSLPALAFLFHTFTSTFILVPGATLPLALMGFPVVASERLIDSIAGSRWGKLIDWKST
ncbi:hypothetical protein [uncultured Adlercreutzia sp.]|uniref:hypothetical protein n=1 Tax=uncultured Adlercreutzia sp. TaxID=875803 RepID=UPI0026F3A257|nr:hypothetical protein [uncultured Adlercreutzia sp.]